MLIPNYLLSIVCLAANPEVLDQCRRTRWIVRLSNEFRLFALRDRRPLPRRPNRRPSFVLTTARAVSVAMQPVQNHTIQKDEPKSSSSIHRKLRKRSKPVSVSISRRHTAASPSAKCFLSKGKLRDVPDKHGWLGWKEGMCVCVFTCWQSSHAMLWNCFLFTYTVYTTAAPHLSTTTTTPIGSKKKYHHRFFFFASLPKRRVRHPADAAGHHVSHPLFFNI